MSFILEALKKSDKKRQDGAVPGLETVHSQSVSGRARRQNLAWLLLSVLLLNAVLLLWLFGPWQQHKSLSAARRPVLSGHLQPEAGIANTQAGTTLSNPAEKEQIGEKRTVAPDSTKTTTEPVQSAARFRRPPPPGSADRSSHAADPGSVRKKVYPLKELPLSIRQKIPELHMSLHAYSREISSANLIRINDQILRTGAVLSDKYLLEEINAEGAVFLYAGYRFLVPRKNPRN